MNFCYQETLRGLLPISAWWQDVVAGSGLLAVSPAMCLIVHNAVVCFEMNGMETYSEIELFSFIRIGADSDRRLSEAAFKELYARLSPRIFAYCKKVLNDTDLAQDVFQDTFIRFYKSAQQERDMTNVAAYLLRIARNLCLNAKRDYGSNRFVELEDYHGSHAASDGDQQELLTLINKALEQLSFEYRDVFVLREYDGLSYAEIGEIVGCSEATAKIRSFRAKQKIREMLAPYLQDLNRQS